MPLKSFQGLWVFVLPTVPWGYMKHKETAHLVPLWRRGWARNTETSETISDGVQSQATTCWIYSQGTTDDHMYVKHTWVSNKPICTVVLLLQNIEFTNYFRCTKHPEKGHGSIFSSPPGKRQTCFWSKNPALIFLLITKKKKGCIHTLVWVWVWFPVCVFYKYCIRSDLSLSSQWRADRKVQLIRCL